MAFVHGKGTFISVEDSSSTPTDISGYCNNVTAPFNAEAAETTVYGIGHKQHIGGIRDTTISLAGLWDPALDALMEPLLGKAGTQGIIYGPAGNGTGTPKYTLSGILTSYEVDSPVGDVTSFSAEFQISGMPTRGVF